MIQSTRRLRWRRERIENYQTAKLLNMMRHAATSVPFYQSLGLDPMSITSPGDLSRFPILEKRDVQNLGDKLLSQNYEKDRLYFSRTSGTSGQPTTTYYDRDSWLFSKYALKIRRMLANGIGLFNRVVIVSEQSSEELENTTPLSGAGVLFKQDYLSIHDPIESHIATLEREDIDAIYAFPSYLKELINFCEARNVALPGTSVVFTSSEVLGPVLRDRVEKFFGCRVCDVYGSTEFKEIAYQCPNGSYHLNFESVYIESESDSDNDGTTQQDFLVTSLVNRAMPLLRFRIGDDCSLSYSACACGNDSPSLARIDGRDIDMVRLEDEKRISPYLLTTAVEQHPEIAQYQIVQKSLHDFELRYVAKSAELNDNELMSIRTALSTHLGTAICLDIKSVAKIPRTASGKHQIFVQAMES